MRWSLATSIGAMIHPIGYQQGFGFEQDILARIIHGGSLRNRAVALRDGHVEPPGREADLKQFVDRPSGESTIAAEAFMNNVGVWIRPASCVFAVSLSGMNGRRGKSRPSLVEI